MSDTCPKCGRPMFELRGSDGYSGMHCSWCAEEETSNLRRQRDALQKENERLKRDLTDAEAQAHRRNLELDALHYVWCSGGCEAGVHRYTQTKLTEEIVIEAERNTARLREWWRKA